MGKGRGMFKAEDEGDQDGSRDVFKAGVQGGDKVLFKLLGGRVKLRGGTVFLYNEWCGCVCQLSAARKLGSFIQIGFTPCKIAFDFCHCVTQWQTLVAERGSCAGEVWLTFAWARQ